MSDLSSFEIRLVGDSGEETTIEWARETVVIIDGADRLSMLGDWPNSWIGQQPPRVIGADSPLLASTRGSDAFIAVCSCSELGCGGLLARVRLDGDTVVWDRFRVGAHGKSRSADIPIDQDLMRFDAMSYRSAIMDPGRRVTSWAPISRRVAALVGDACRSSVGGDNQFRCVGAEHLGDEAVRVSVLIRWPDKAKEIVSRTFEIGADEPPDSAAAPIIDYFNNRDFLTDSTATRRDL